MNFRIGFGYDVHRLKEGRELWVGGVPIAHTKGSEGHSDADALIHAICDALLGALALGDIGIHFPDTSSEYKNIDSKILLQKTAALIREKGWEIGNLDCSVSLEKPKIMKHSPMMKAALAHAAGIEESQISIKATTGERMGFVGREEGWCAYAVALVYKTEI
jgi:2-C-methyl-D-erythritol 2,4-cyclodiphosphate synthase